MFQKLGQKLGELKNQVKLGYTVGAGVVSTLFSSCASPDHPYYAAQARAEGQGLAANSLPQGYRPRSESSAGNSVRGNPDRSPGYAQVEPNYAPQSERYYPSAQENDSYRSNPSRNGDRYDQLERRYDLQNRNRGIRQDQNLEDYIKRGVSRTGLRAFDQVVRSAIPKGNSGGYRGSSYRPRSYRGPGTYRSYQ